MTAPRRVLASLAVFVVCVSAVDIAVARFGRSWDLTAERSATLSDETARVLHAVHKRIQITAFFGRDSLGRVEAATLLERYHRTNRKITFRILDPAIDPGEMRRLGVEGEGSAGAEDLSRPKHFEIAQFVIEIDVTSAIARLLRDVQGTICFSTGHGERASGDSDPKGLGQATDTLHQNGYHTRDVDLLAAPSVPKVCDALVIASPTARFETAAQDAVVTYLRNTGKVFALADPDANIDLTGLVRPWGVQFVHGVVVEASEGSHLPDDLTAPIINTYLGSSPPVQGLGPTFFPRVEGVRTHNVSDPGVTVAPIALTSKLAYLDTQDIGHFDEKVDVPGPIAVGAAVDSSSVARPGTKRAKILRTRILAWGDVDFLSNQFYNDGSNARLWIQGIDWLAQPEELVTAVSTFPKVRELKLTAARSKYMLFLMAGVVPGLFVLAGAFVWVFRRSR